jgi:hypothetical protein
MEHLCDSCTKRPCRSHFGGCVTKCDRYDQVIARPLSLIPSINLIVGNERSHKIIQAAYDEAYQEYQQTTDAGWSYEDSIRNADRAFKGSIESKVHELVVMAEESSEFGSWFDRLMSRLAEMIRPLSREDG